MLAEALFRRVGARGFKETTIRLTDEAVAHGFEEVLPEQFGTSVSGRGERTSTATKDLPITMCLAEPPAPYDLVRSA